VGGSPRRPVRPSHRDGRVGSRRGRCVVGLAFAEAPIALVALAVVAALAEAPFSPAANAQLVMLVPPEHRAWATATRSAAVGAGLVIGGALVAAVGAPTAFLVNAASFVVSALLVLRVTGGP
jgi:MFS family permease